MDPRGVITLLNSLDLGEIGRVTRELEAAEAALLELGLPELGARLQEAGRKLRGGDVREFRRALAQVTAKLGHVR
jgi:hypothetical protein